MHVNDVRTNLLMCCLGRVPPMPVWHVLASSEACACHTPDVDQRAMHTCELSGIAILVAGAC
jgi:hypothetical protein